MTWTSLVLPVTLSLPKGDLSDPTGDPPRRRARRVLLRTHEETMNDTSSVVEFFHSLLRWGVLLAVAVAGLVALIGYLRNSPILTWERGIAILAMVLCHVQLVVGLILYAMRYSTLPNRFADDQLRFWKYEHITIMILGIALVTMGRSLSKRAKTEQGKQLRIAVFYLIALVLFLWGTPWPTNEINASRGWL
jgi:hypothetical protein